MAATSLLRATGRASRRSSGVEPPFRSANGTYSSWTKLVEFADGTSSTFLIGESSNLDPFWATYINFKYGSSAAPYYPNDGPAFFDGCPYISSAAGQHQRLFNYRLPPEAATSTSTSYRTERSKSFGSEHEGGAQFVYGDGSVRFLSNFVQPDQFTAMATINTGEVIDE